MAVLTSLHIANFRGFKGLTVRPLKRVNLIIGQNNNGKTGLLEALALLLANPLQSAANLPQLFRVTGGDLDENFWQWIIHNKDPKGIATINSSLDTFQDFGVMLTVESRPLEFVKSETGAQLGTKFLWPILEKMSIDLKVAAFSTRPTDATQDAIDYNRVVLKRGKKQVEALLRTIEPRLETIETLQTGKSPLLYADIGLNEMIPVTQMGQGFNRLLDIYSEIVAAEAKVLLIDEIENGIHYSVLPTIWTGLFNAAQEGRRPNFCDDT